MVQLLKHMKFPEKINVHFVEVISKMKEKCLTWERGAQVTQACGTGATSTAISGFKLGLLIVKFYCIFLSGT